MPSHFTDTLLEWHKGTVARASIDLRMLGTTARTALAALVNLATLYGRTRGPRVTLAPGDLAPEFVLPASDGRSYRLSDFRDRRAVVLAWFPKAFTPGCTAECQSLQARARELDARAVQYFAISTDDPETNRRFAASIGLGYPVLSDRDGAVGRAYGVVGPTGFASRWTFFIGPDGRIAAIDKAVRVSSHGQDIAARLAQLGLGEGPAGP